MQYVIVSVLTHCYLLKIREVVSVEGKEATLPDVIYFLLLKQKTLLLACKPHKDETLNKRQCTICTHNNSTRKCNVVGHDRQYIIYM